MRAGALARAALALAVVLTAGCAGAQASAPTPTPPRTGATPSVPPAAGELTGGTALHLGSAHHWALGGGLAFTANGDGTVAATELATGATAWRASFGRGEPWDATPTLALNETRDTVVALRTVDFEGVSRLDLLLLDAATGAVRSELLVADPRHGWHVDLPPRVLAADGDTIVLTADPESGRQTGIVEVSSGKLAWQVEEEAVAASADLVVTRSGGWDRTTGERRWRSAQPLGPLIAQVPGRLVVSVGSVAVWLRASDGAELARTGRLAESDAPCAAAETTLVCLASGVRGYELAGGAPLWTSSMPAQSILTALGWAYLGRDGDRGDVVDARTGELLRPDVRLPPIRYADRAGLLLGTDDGFRWVPFIR